MPKSTDKKWWINICPEKKVKGEKVIHKMYTIVMIISDLKLDTEAIWEDESQNSSYWHYYLDSHNNLKVA